MSNGLKDLLEDTAIFILMMPIAIVGAALLVGTSIFLTYWVFHVFNLA